MKYYLVALLDKESGKAIENSTRHLIKKIKPKKKTAFYGIVLETIEDPDLFKLEEIIKDMIEYVLEHKKVDVRKIREEAAIMMSCKKSIKANHYLKNNEMADLVNQLRETEDPFTCPHGRPIIINFSNYELERLFKRIV